MMSMCGPMTLTFVEVLRIEGDNELADRLMNFAPHLPKKVKDLMGEEWKTYLITHNDAWFNNFMFKYENLV